MGSTRIRLVALALALGTFSLAGQVTAQTPEQRIAAAMERVEAAGLPVEILESKLAEGHAKGVALDRIAMAIERRADALGRASEALGRAHEGRPETADLAVGADAIEAGVSGAVLERIATVAGPERRTVAIAALAYLVAEGHVPEAALERVEAALARGADALGNLPGMAQDRARMGPPAGVPPAGQPGGVGRPGGPPSGPPSGPPGGPPN